MAAATGYEGASRRDLLAGGALLLTLAAASPLLAAAADAPTAETEYGAVRGEAEDGISVFRGVPYGAPTGGGARFMPPQPPKPWGGLRDARRFGDQCPQLPPPAGPAWANPHTNLADSEDCLSLNIWTPGVADGKKRPVMVWFHGGGYATGSGASPVYDGVRLCRRGDVVLVTVNHRLNVFGYLYLADLGGPKYADSGNIGQLDLIAALQWVQGNIEGFGGDPSRVMIFGESGGGGKVSNLLASPAAKGLFHRAAIQSGPALTSLHPDAATAAAGAFLRAAGVGHPDDLQHAPPDRLLDGLRKALKDDPSLRFGPVVDGRTLPRDPFSPDAPALSADVPIIVGYNATETTLFSALATPSDFDLDWPGLKARLAPSLAGADADKLVADLRALRPDATAADLYFLVSTERGMGAGSVAIAERKAALAAAGAYLYRLEFATPVDRLRSPHALDVPMVFDNAGAATAILGPAVAQAQAVADQMSPAWIAFARTGSPNAAGLPSWPRYDPRARSTMLFNTVSRAMNDPDAELRQLIAALPPPAPMGI